MSDYDCKIYVGQAFDVLKNDLDRNRWRTGDPQTARGRLLIKFVALILCFSLTDPLIDVGDKDARADRPQALDTVMAVGDGEGRRITEATVKCRRFLEVMGVPRPNEVIETKPYRHVPSRYPQRSRISVS